MCQVSIAAAAVSQTAAAVTALHSTSPQLMGQIALLPCRCHGDMGRLWEKTQTENQDWSPFSRETSRQLLQPNWHQTYCIYFPLDYVSEVEREILTHGQPRISIHLPRSASLTRCIYSLLKLTEPMQCVHINSGDSFASRNLSPDCFSLMRSLIKKI